jgi:hypothetical protein
MFFGPFLLKTSTPYQILPSLRQQGGGWVVQYLTLCSIHRTPSLACFFSAAVSMARRKGSVSYNYKVLIQLIGKIFPNGEYG